MAFSKTLFFLPSKVSASFASIIAYLLVIIELFTLFLLFLILTFSLYLSTGWGTAFLTKNTQNILASLSDVSPEGIGIAMKVEEISFEEGISVKNFSLLDKDGLWLEVGSLYIDFNPLQIMSLLGRASIDEILLDRVFYYRNPSFAEKIEEEESSPFIIPQSVLPLPLGEINIEKIEITNAYVGAEVMHLEDFGMDLHADIYASALLQRKKASFKIKVDEKNTQVQGTIDYIPGEFIVDLQAVDEIWGKTFPLLDKANLDVKASVRAKQFPLTKEFPLYVDLLTFADFHNIVWFNDHLSPSLSTEFLFDGTSVIFKDTELIDENAHIYIPSFALNVDTMIYDEASATVNIDKLSAFSPFFHGSAYGEVLFWGSVFDMHTKADLGVNDFVFNQGLELSTETAQEANQSMDFIEADTLIGSIEGFINIEEELDIQGNFTINSTQIALLDNKRTTFLKIDSKFNLTTEELALKNLSINIEDIKASAPKLSMNFEELIKGSYLSMLDGELNISSQSLKAIMTDLPLSGLGELTLDFSQARNDRIISRAYFSQLNYEELLLDSLQISCNISDLNSLVKLQFPQIDGQISSSALYSHERISELLPRTLFRNGFIDFRVDNDILHIKANTDGRLVLDSSLDYNILESKININNFTFNYKPKKQQITLKTPLEIDFKNALTLSPASFEIFDETSKEEATISLEAFLDDTTIKTNLNGTIPTALIDSYQDGLLPGEKLDFNIELQGNRYNPTGKAHLLLDDILKGKEEKVKLIFDGDISNKNFNFNATLGTSKQIEFHAEGTVPLLFDPYPFIDLESPFQSSLSWQGNLSTLWQFVPFAQRNLEGNGMIELSAEGSLANPLLIGKAYTSKARFQDESLGIVISDIDLEADISLEEISVNIYARDGSVASFGEKNIRDKNALIINAKMFKENENYMLDAIAAASEFSPLKRDDLSLTLNGRLNVTGPLKTPYVRGIITVLDGSYHLTQYDSTSISTLENVTILRNARSKREEAEETFFFNPSLNARINIRNNFEVSGLGLQSTWGGSLSLFGTLSSPLLVGSLEPNEGIFDFLGKEFELSRSLISFTGSVLLPIYDINVERESESTSSLVRISGAGTNIKLELSSIPPYPTDEVIARMFFGKPLADLSQFEAIQVATTAAQLLSPDLNKLNIFSATRQALGLHVLRLGSFENNELDEDVNILNDASIEAGTYLNDVIYLGVERGIEDTAVKVEVELFPNVKLEGHIGTDSSKAGITWSDDY